jgi:hypothetical protein
VEDSTGLDSYSGEEPCRDGDKSHVARGCNSGWDKADGSGDCERGVIGTADQGAGGGEGGGNCSYVGTLNIPRANGQKLIQQCGC